MLFLLFLLFMLFLLFLLFLLFMFMPCSARGAMFSSCCGGVASCPDHESGPVRREDGDRPHRLAG